MKLIGEDVEEEEEETMNFKTFDRSTTLPSRSINFNACLCHEKRKKKEGKCATNTKRLTSFNHTHTHTYRIGIGIGIEKQSIQLPRSTTIIRSLSVISLSRFIFFSFIFFSIPSECFIRDVVKTQRDSLTHLFLYLFTCLFPHKLLIILKTTTTTTTIDDSIVYDCNRISMV